MIQNINSIIAILLIAVNLPTLTAVLWGIKLHTDSTCPEDIKSVKHNKLSLKLVLLIDLILSILLIIFNV